MRNFVKLFSSIHVIRFISVISIIGFSGVISISCSHKEKIPRGILAREQMQSVVWDLISAGEFLQGYVFKDTTTAVEKNAKAVEWYDHIFSLHKTTRAVFEKSLTWYKEHPAFMKQMLDSLSNKPVPVPLDRPPGPDTTKFNKDSARIKDSITKNTIILPGQHKPDSYIDSLKKARVKALKATGKEGQTPKPPFLPGHLKSAISMDSVRRARLNRMIDTAR